MAEIKEFTKADLERLAGKLEAIDLTDDERAVLVGVFSAAGHALAGESEVEGFAVPPTPKGATADGLVGHHVSIRTR